MAFRSPHYFVMREAAACGRMKPKDHIKLTDAQDKWLRRANERGQIVWHGPRGYGRSVYERVMMALEAKSLVTPNAFGEYEITPAGRALVSSQDRGTAPHQPSHGE
jgi:hypothetical protein